MSIVFTLILKSIFFSEQCRYFCQNLIALLNDAFNIDVSHKRGLLFCGPRLFPSSIVEWWNVKVWIGF